MLISAFALGLIAQAQKLPVYHYKAGFSYQSSFKIQVTACDTKQTMTAVVALKTDVVSAKPTSEVVEKLTASVEGNARRFTIRRNSLGALTGFQSNGAKEEDDPLTSFLFALKEPARAGNVVHDGGRWSSTMLNPFDGKSKIPVRLRFDGPKVLGGKKVLQVTEQVRDIQLDPQHKISGEAVYLLDPKTGDVEQVIMSLSTTLDGKAGDLIKAEEQRKTIAAHPGPSSSHHS